MIDLKQFGERVIGNLEQVIVGKLHALELLVIGLLCQGHVLIEDVPGVCKIMLARSLAKSLDCTFNRIQFTPDMLPSDVTGVSIYNQQKRKFEFRAGPILGQVILADEVNRATPKTQAALLEAMEERQVTVDGVTHPLPAPFMVLATQNPIEYEGTFPLPEAQLDRFLLRVRMGYPSAGEEVKILGGQQLRHPIEALESAYPLRVERYALRPDTGGSGKFRGRLGLRRDLRVVGQARRRRRAAEKTRRVQYSLFIQVIDVETSLIKFQHESVRSKAVKG